MAWRLDKSVVKVEIDNRVQGRVEGRVWLHGRQEPIVLSLRGNCWRDMAGCLTTAVNPAPREGDHVNLHERQDGTVGDFTASRKVRVLDVSVEESLRLGKAGKEVPEHMGNAVYFEWFSDANGRVVIESVDYQVTVSEPAWRMSGEEEAGQRQSTQEAMHEWMDRLSEALAAQEGEEFDAEEDADGEGEPYQPMNEFEWEKFMKESDVRTDKYGQLIEKYQHHPDSERLIAREMGWTWLEELMDADEKGLFEEERKAAEREADEPLVPDPLTEGRDWIRTEDGDIRHPLSHRAFHLSVGIWHACDDRGLLGETADKDLRDMIFQTQMLSAKLAGALNSLGYDGSREGGFVVACLKRALQFFDGAVAAWEKVQKKKLLDEDLLGNYRRDLFEIREEMLRLMERYRRQ
ncbi:MAG: hypothetical protein JXB04_12840 [Kiritimatiellae bacterium]|nr:hypothetical protein [Kiritimatiellia bacterium]